MQADSIRVLIVDDHGMFAEMLSRALESEPDIEVVGTATTGREAYGCNDELTPDVVLLDYGLPDEDGTIVAARIKAASPETKVVMLTAHEKDDVLVRAIEAGCSGFVTKMEPIDKVPAAIRAAHSGEALVSPEMLARLLPRLRAHEATDRTALTKRELEILGFLAEGTSNQAIADTLFLSIATVRNHVQSIITKLGTHSKLEAVSAAVRRGIIGLAPLPHR